MRKRPVTRHQGKLPEFQQQSHFRAALECERKFLRFSWFLVVDL
jgi:hypothetical protein